MAVKAKAVEPSTMAEIFPDWELKDRIYVLTKKATPITFQLRSRHTEFRGLEWFDPKTKYPRALRYVTNQSALFEDEQRDDFRLGAIVFEDGKLTVSSNNTTLQQFLALHPDNKANGGSIFYEFDPDAEARADLEKQMKGFEAVSVAIELPIENLEAIYRVAFPTKNVDEVTSGEIKRDVVLFAKNKPAEFDKIANNSNILMRNLAERARSLGIIKISDDNSTVKWGANGKVIAVLGWSQDPVSALASWMKSDEGIEFVESLSNKLGA